MDQTKRDVEACFAHARDLLRAAKRVLEAEQLPSVSFHLAILALEEIGKASLLGARSIAREIGGETIFVDNRLDDHVFKLFWALWTPSFARGKDVKKDEFENVRGFAKRLHEDRLAAMYVTPDRHAGEHPLLDVSQTQARGLLKLAEARLSSPWPMMSLPF
jgi:AbiV family abortive infection protein